MSKLDDLQRQPVMTAADALAFGRRAFKARAEDDATVTLPLAETAAESEARMILARLEVQRAEQAHVERFAQTMSEDGNSV